MLDFFALSLAHTHTDILISLMTVNIIFIWNFNTIPLHKC